MFTPKSWTIICSNVSKSYQAYNEELSKLETEKLATGLNKGIDEWKNKQLELSDDFKKKVADLSVKLLEKITEDTLDAVRKATEIADEELKDALNKKSDKSSIDEKKLRIDVKRLIDRQTKIINGTFKQQLIHDKRLVNDTAIMSKFNTKCILNNKEQTKNINPRLIEKQTLFDTVKKYALDSSSHGMKVRYKNGKEVSLRAYAEMSIRAEVQAITLDNMTKSCNNLGIDLFLASEHQDCAEDHVKYQGKVYTTNPRKYSGKYPSKQEAEKNGFCTRPNCRHYWIPITKDQAENLEDTKKRLIRNLPKFDKKNYEDLKTQRKNERNIRFYKERENQLDILLKASPDEVTKAELLFEKKQTHLNVLAWQKAQRELMATNPTLTREYQRENVKSMAKDLGFKIEFQKDVDKEENTKYNGNVILNRPILDRSDIPPISKKKLKKAKKRVKELSGDIIHSKDTEKYLDYKNVNAATLGNLIFIRKDATASEVFEEVYHLEQNTKKPVTSDPIDIYEREIEAAEYLIKNKDKLGICDKEHEQNKTNLEIYKTKLEEILGRRGQNV